MYTYTHAVVLPKYPESQYMEYNISDKPLYKLFNTFDEMFVTLFNNVTNVEVYVRLSELKSMLYLNPLSFNDWLVQNADNILPTIPVLPNLNVRYCSYTDGFQNGYIVDLPKIGINVEESFDPADTTTAVLTREDPNTDLTLIDDYCLVSVNGFIHRTDSNKDRTLIQDGVTTLRKSNNNSVGITSFLSIGNISKISILESDILKVNEPTPLKDKLYFRVTQNITSNQSYLLVLGGYLIVPKENVFWQTSADTFYLDLTYLSLIQKYFQSKNYIDMSHLELQTATENTVDVNELLSDGVIRKYLTMDKSFLVIVNTPDLKIREHFLAHETMPNRYETRYRPRAPLFLHNGKMAEYTYRCSSNGFIINVNDTFRRRFVFELIGPNPQGIITRNELPSTEYVPSPSKLLEFYKEI